jgi:hypothetical protein
LENFTNYFDFIKVIYLYGPSALLVFILVFAESKARSALKDAPAGNVVLFKAIYSGVWITFFSLVAVICFMFYNANREATIEGTFENLEGSDTVASSAPFYFHKVYIDNLAKHFNYEWRVITNMPFPSGTTLTFDFDRVTEHGPRSDQYEINVDSSAYKAPIRILYHHKDDTLTLQSNGQTINLTSKEQLTQRSQRNWFSSVAYAAETFSPSGFADRLQAEDPIIRRGAQDELVKDGGLAVPWIEQSLADPKTPDRMRAGLLAALTRISSNETGALDTGAIDSIVLANASKNDLLHRTARHYLATHATWSLDSEINEILVNAEKQDKSRKKVSPSSAQLGLAEMEVLYNLGISEKDRYASGKPLDPKILSDAIKAFQKGWELSAMAPPEQRVVYAKCLYGWGLALHSQSWLERDPNNQRKEELVTSAQEKFGQFVKVVNDSADPTEYPYPEHLTRAKAYIQQPVPASLRDDVWKPRSA